MTREGRSRNVVARVIDWLRAGYPDGVPQQDYVALLGILHRQLTEEEIIEIAQTLSDGDPADVEERIRLAITRRTLQPATDDEVARVSARLATAGWPLAVVEAESPDGQGPNGEQSEVSPPQQAAGAPAPETEEVRDVAEQVQPRAADPDARRNVIQRLITWVRHGFPTGVPAADTYRSSRSSVAGSRRTRSSTSSSSCVAPGSCRARRDASAPRSWAPRTRCRASRRSSGYATTWVRSRARTSAPAEDARRTCPCP